MKELLRRSNSEDVRGAIPELMLPSRCKGGFDQPQDTRSLVFVGHCTNIRTQHVAIHVRPVHLDRTEDAHLFRRIALAT